MLCHFNVVGFFFLGLFVLRGSLYGGQAGLGMSH